MPSFALVVLSLFALFVHAIKPTEEQIRTLQMEKGVNRKPGITDRIGATTVDLVDLNGKNASLPQVYQCEGCRVVLEEVEFHLNRMMQKSYEKVHRSMV